MKALKTLFGLGFGLLSVLTAQSPLTTTFVGGYYYNNNNEGASTFFNMVVNTTITVTRLDVNCINAFGIAGTVELWQTNGAITGFNGSETTPANWTLLGTAAVVSAGSGQPSAACFAVPITLTPSTHGYAVVHRGVMPLFTQGTATNLQYVNSEITLNAGAVAPVVGVYTDGALVPFVAAPANPYVFNGSIYYTNGATAAPCAYSERYSTGCGGEWASWYDLIEDPAVASTALSGKQLVFAPDNPAAPATYTVIKTIGTLIASTTHPVLNGTFTSTIAGATPDDDGEVVVPIAGSFLFPGGSTSSFVVSTNGMVSVASNLAYLGGFGATDWGPLVPALIEAPNAAWYSWHDYDATALNGGGQIKAFDDTANQRLIVTWDAVESYPQGAGNPGTFQMVFDYATNSVSITWGTLASVGSGGLGDEHLVGWSPGGVNLRPAEGDITDGIPEPLIAAAFERADLLLTSDARPVHPTVIQYSVANVPPIGIGLLFFSVANPNPFPGTNLALFGLGKPRCMLNFDISAYIDGSGIGFFFVADGPVGPGLDTATITPSLVGAEFWVQAVHLLSDGFNLFPASTSNAVHQLVQTF